MIRQFRPQNFRIFTNDVNDFTFKPITFLTGSNSSGKSSLVKAIIVVQNYIETLRNRFLVNGSFDPAKINLNLSSMNLKLGGYTSCVNKGSDDSRISFSYEVSSDLAPYKFEVSLSFDKSPKDDGTEGELDSIEIKLSDERILYMKREKNQLKLDSIKCNGFLMYAFITFMKSRAVHYRENTSEEWNQYKYGTHKTYFNNDEIKDRYPVLFKTEFIRALKVLDESQILFYFPIMSTFIGLDKEACIVKLKSLSPADTLECTRLYDEYQEILERVVKSFQASEYESFMDYYLNLENETLDKFHSNFNIVGFHTRYDLIRDEICANLKLACRNTRWSKWPVLEFEDIYTLLTLVSWEDPKLDSYVKKDFYYDAASGEPEFTASHNLYEAFVEFIHLLFSELLMTPQFTNLYYVNDSFTGVQRMYTYNNQSSFAQVIREYADLKYLLDGSAENHYNDDYYNTIVKFKSGDFINKWLKEFCDIESLNLSSDKDGYGYVLSVTHSDGLVTPLADEGHGITQLVHLLLQIECQILRKKRSILDYPNQLTINYTSLAVDSPVLAVEEPEVSLHPSLQSKLALLFNDAYQTYMISFIIETHSEYLIRKSQAIISQYDTEGKDFEENPFKIYYFNPDGSSYEITYGESGRLQDSFGPGFFDEAGNSTIVILKREQKKR